MVGDAVEQRAGEALAGEDRGPFLEGQVRGDDGGAVLVAPAEDVEQELASGLRQGHVLPSSLARCASGRAEYAARARRAGVPIFLRIGWRRVDDVQFERGIP